MVDCFSKWVDLVTLRTKESLEIAEWFTQEFIPWFGVPRFVRVDAGLEFKKRLKTAVSCLVCRFAGQVRE